MPLYSAFILLPGASIIAAALLQRISMAESDAWRIVLLTGVVITGFGLMAAVVEIF